MADLSEVINIAKKALTNEAARQASALGIPETNGPLGYNDARDAFRHAYISAMIRTDFSSPNAKVVGEYNEYNSC